MRTNAYGRARLRRKHHHVDCKCYPSTPVSPRVRYRVNKPKTIASNKRASNRFRIGVYGMLEDATLRRAKCLNEMVGGLTN